MTFLTKSDKKRYHSELTTLYKMDKLRNLFLMRSKKTVTHVGKWYERGRSFDDSVEAQERYDRKSIGPLLRKMPLIRYVDAFNVAATKEGLPNIRQNSPYYVLVLGIGKGSEAKIIKEIWEGTGRDKKDLRIIGIENDPTADFSQNKSLFHNIYSCDYTNPENLKTILKEIKRPFFDAVVVANPSISIINETITLAGKPINSRHYFNENIAKGILSSILYLAPNSPFIFTFFLELEYTEMLERINTLLERSLIINVNHSNNNVPNEALFQIKPGISPFVARNNSYIIGRTNPNYAFYEN